MTQLIHTHDYGSRVNFAAAPEPREIDALIRHGYRFDDRSKQWWARGTAGSVQDTPAFFDWLATQPAAAQDRDAHQYRFQSYYTPAQLAQRLVELAQVETGMACLEPSAGYGAIASELVEAGGAVRCVEVDPDAVTQLRFDFDVLEADFLAVLPSELYDRVVMNPPFSRDQDCRHALHAWQFLKPGGRLVAIVGHYAVYGTRNPDRDRFRALMTHHGRVVDNLPAGSFPDCTARAVIVELTK